MLRIENGSYLEEETTDILDVNLCADFNIVRIITGTRIVRGISSLHEDQDIFFIYEQAIPEHYTPPASWSARSMISLNGHEITAPVGRRENYIKVTVRENDDWSVLCDDNGDYLASFSKNVLLLNGKLHFFNSHGIEAILDHFSLKTGNRGRIIKRKLERILETGINSLLEEKEEVLIERKQMLEDQRDSYKNSVKLFVEIEKEMTGLREWGERRKRSILEEIDGVVNMELIDSVELSSGRKISVMTKPIIVGLWNIGQYCIQWDRDWSLPKIERIVPGSNLNHHEYAIGRNNKVRMIHSDHPHVHLSICSGNAASMLEAFWSDNMVAGVNFAIQFIKSYDIKSPFIRFEEFLYRLGYRNDANILNKIGVLAVDDGKIYLRREGMRPLRENPNTWWEVTCEDLVRLGCTGKVDCNMDNYRSDYLGSKDRDLVDQIISATHDLDEWDHDQYYEPPEEEEDYDDVEEE